MPDNLKNTLAFPVGYHKFHPKQLFNFQLNRPYSFGYARYQDLLCCLSTRSALDTKDKAPQNCGALSYFSFCVILQLAMHRIVLRMTQ